MGVVFMLEGCTKKKAGTSWGPAFLCEHSLMYAARYAFVFFIVGQPVMMATVEMNASTIQYQLLVATATGEIPAMEPASSTWAA